MAVLAVVGVLNVLPGLGLLGASQLESLYGVQALDPTEAILLRHRALLLALLGGLLIASIWVTSMRAAVLVAALVSKVVFVLLVLSARHTAEVARVAVIDAVALAFLSAALWLTVANRPTRATTGDGGLGER